MYLCIKEQQYLTLNTYNNDYIRGIKTRDFQ